MVVSGAKLPKVDNGHIVPRMFQKAWENAERKVAVHQVGGEGCKRQSTKKAGTRGAYYRRTRPQGVEIDDFEASLGGIENRAADPLRDLIAGESITVERKGAVGQLIAAQMMRGPAFFKAHDELMEEAFDGMQAKDFRPRYLASVGGDVERARAGVRAVYGNGTNRLTTMLSYSMKVASILTQMRWHVLRFEKPVLAYSDQPVVLWPMNVGSTRPFRRPHLGPLTMLEIRVPISPRVAILMNWIDRSDVIGVKLDSRAAAELNAFTVAQADREWMHLPGVEPRVPDATFAPLTRFVDEAYDRATAERSLRRQYATKTRDRVRSRTWVRDLDVITNIGYQGKAA
jgi:uncharacterized protein DUF4238